jgi:S-adenosylmethionine hydrolase
MRGMSTPRVVSFALALAALAGCASTDAAPPIQGPVVLMTDFGLKDDAVGLLRGVVLSIAPRAQVVDLTHEAPRYEVDDAARLLAEAPGLYPPRTVFVVVVDPGVGTSRRAIAARFANGTTLVGPDNGVLSVAIERHGPAEVRVLENRALMRDRVSSTFHGRDVFAPVGGHLAAGVPFEQVGPIIDDWIRLRLPAPEQGQRFVSGIVVSIDEPFGNLWTNVEARHLEAIGLKLGDVAQVTLGERTLDVTYAETFGDVAVGQPLLYVNSRGQASLAINMGDFARTHAIAADSAIRISRP